MSEYPQSSNDKLTQLNDGDEIYTREAREGLLSLDEVRRERQRRAFEKSALDLAAQQSGQTHNAETSPILTVEQKIAANNMAIRALRDAELSGQAA